MQNWLLDIWNEIGHFDFLYCVILFVPPYTEQPRSPDNEGRTGSATYHDTVHLSDNKVMAQPRIRVEWRRQPVVGSCSDCLAVS